MVGGYQHTMEFHGAGLYGSLTGKEEVKLTLTFLLDGIFFQVLDGLGVFDEASQPGRPPGPLPP